MNSITRRQALLGLGITLVAPVLVACGSTGAGTSTAASAGPVGASSPAAAKPAGSSIASAKPAASPSASAKPASAGGAAVTKVKYATGAFNLSSVASLVAEDKGYLREAGIELETSLLQSTTQVLDALVSGDIHFGQPFLGGTITAFAKNQHVLQVANFWSRSTIVGIIRKEKLPSGVSPEAFQKLPLNDRVKALKGLKVGISGIGGLIDVTTRILVKTAGLDAERDLEIVNVANTPALLGAFKQGQISSYQGTPPDPNQSIKADGGVIYFNGPAGDGPSTLSEQASTGVATTQEFAKQNPAQVRAFAQTIAKANDFVRANPKETADLMKKRFPKIDPDIVEESVMALLPAVAPGARFTTGQITGAVEFAKLGGGLKTEVKSEEGTFWTNEFLK